MRRSGYDAATGGDPAKYNELSFQDQAGREEVFVRAQRNLREDVLHDHATHVHAAQSNTVDTSQTETIGVDQTLRVKRDRKGVIDRDDQLLVRRHREAKVLGDDTMNVVGEHRVRIDGREDRVVGGKGRETTVERWDELTVNGTRYTHVRDGLTVVADASIELTAPLVTIDAERNVRIQRGDETTIVLDADGGIAVEAPKLVKLRAGHGTVTITPGKVTLDSGEGATIELAGGDITIRATGNVNINGAMVRLNS